jgi:hypothetical protein
MGKASSAKKVARAARAGGATTTAPKRRLAFPLGIAAIVIAGSAIIFFARDTGSSTPTVPLDITSTTVVPGDPTATDPATTIAPATDTTAVGSP